MTTCSNNDRYDISRNDCAVFPSAAEYLKRVASVNNTTTFGNKTTFRDYKEKLRHQTQLMHTRQFVVKGNPPTTYKKSAILTTGTMNECDQLIPSEYDSAKRANYYVRRRYKHVETV
jgi:hypothetical protein